LRGRQTFLLLGAACLAGAGTMAIELSAVRLIAPWFGTSQAVWTSAIGAVLIALSVGYLVGGRWAGRERPERALAVSLWAAAAWAACLPSIAPWISGALIPEGASLEQVASTLPLASLACALTLFFPPAVCLATAGPLVVELIVRSSGCSAGRAGGQVLAVSTVGSLIGTFGTTYLGVPFVGLSGTLWVTAGLIACAALLSAPAGRHHLASALVLGTALASPAETGRSAEGLLASGESPYQRVRVVERADGWRALEVNERRGSFQSLWSPTPGLLGPGYYYDYFALPPAWSRAESEWSLLVLGLGGGTAWRVVEGSLPEDCELHAAGVELDPMVVSMSRSLMGLPEGDPRRRVIAGWDARAAIAPLVNEGRRWDQVVIDVYANQVEIPAHLATYEFFLEVSGLLDDGGWLQLNVGAIGWDDPLALAIGATLAEAFGRPTLALEVPFSRNVILVQRLGAPTFDPQSQEFLPGRDDLEWLVQRSRLPGTWGHIHTGDAPHLVDQYAPLESLQRESFKRLQRLP